jgi:hypothetical protein
VPGETPEGAEALARSLTKKSVRKLAAVILDREKAVALAADFFSAVCF